MNRRLLLLPTLWALLAVPTHAGTAPRELAAGRKAYEKGDYDAALKAFEAAAKDAPSAKLDPAVPHFNAGLALLQLNKPEDSATQFAEALRSPDLGLQARAYYNRGLALHRQATALDGQTNLESAVRVMAESGAMFEKSLTLQPDDRDAKINLELTQRYIADLLENGRRAEQLVAEVERLVTAYEYEQARDLVGRTAPSLARGLALRPKAQSRLQEMVQKIEEVLGILTAPAAAAAPTPPPTP